MCLQSTIDFKYDRSVPGFSFACALRRRAKLNPRTPLADALLGRPRPVANRWIQCCNEASLKVSLTYTGSAAGRSL